MKKFAQILLLILTGAYLIFYIYTEFNETKKDKQSRRKHIDIPTDKGKLKEFTQKKNMIATQIHSEILNLRKKYPQLSNFDNSTFFIEPEPNVDSEMYPRIKYAYHNRDSYLSVSIHFDQWQYEPWAHPDGISDEFFIKEIGTYLHCYIGGQGSDEITNEIRNIIKNLAKTSQCNQRQDWNFKWNYCQ